METIDLRSDTVTRPTEAMRKVMASAEVGDDVYGEDPTVNRLQEMAAELTGKEAALFVTSGTMGNQAAIAAATRPGDAVLVGDDAHILLYESGAGAALWGVQVETLGSGGFFSGADVAAAIHPVDIHYAPARMLAIENTHNQSGGRVFPLDQLKEAAAVARDNGLTVHLDGARIFNAAAASGTPVATWAEPFDSLTFCLSKGLGAPIGSVLCGSSDFILRAQRAQLGGLSGAPSAATVAPESWNAKSVRPISAGAGFRDLCNATQRIVDVCFGHVHVGHDAHQILG
jgi:threonine aldolase